MSIYLCNLHLKDNFYLHLIIQLRLNCSLNYNTLSIYIVLARLNHSLNHNLLSPLHCPTSIQHSSLHPIFKFISISLLLSILLLLSVSLLLSISLPITIFRPIPRNQAMNGHGRAPTPAFPRPANVCRYVPLTSNLPPLSILHSLTLNSNPDCRSTTTRGEWRHVPARTGPIYCNACGIYLKEHGFQRSLELVQKQRRSEGREAARREAARREAASAYGTPPASAPARAPAPAPAPARAPTPALAPAPAPLIHQGFVSPGPAGRMPLLSAPFVPPRPFEAPAMDPPGRYNSITSILNSALDPNNLAARTLPPLVPSRCRG
jgi:hypothetical protein